MLVIIIVFTVIQRCRLIFGGTLEEKVISYEYNLYRRNGFTGEVTYELSHEISKGF